MREGNSSLTPRDAGASAPVQFHGPWRPTSSADGNVYDDFSLESPDDGYQTAIIVDCSGVVVAFAYVEGLNQKADDQLIARQSLIAAAPDMLEALKLLVADVQDYAAWQRPCYALDVAREAIAKATQPAASRGEATPNPTAELGA